MAHRTAICNRSLIPTKLFLRYTIDALAKIARDVVNATREKVRNYLVLSEKELRKRIEAAALERRNKLLGPPEDRLKRPSFTLGQ